MLLIQDRSTQPSVRDGCLYTGSIGVIWAALRVVQGVPTPNEVASALLQKVRSLLEQIIAKVAQDSGQDKEKQLALLVGTL